MVKRQQPFSQRLIICHGHLHYSIATSIKVAEHSFQVPMPNSPLLLNYL